MQRMQRQRPILGLAATGMVALGALAQGTAPSPEKAVLAARCAPCHGIGKAQPALDTMSKAGRLRIDNALTSGRMPPAPATLNPSERKTLLGWLRNGKDQGTHWAFAALPASRPSPPAPSSQLPSSLGWKRGTTQNPLRPDEGGFQAKGVGVARNEQSRGDAGTIDAFVLAKLREKGLGFSPEADKRTLLRRVTYDLIGLPPTPDELQAFVTDPTPGAYERVVNRLLADPRYGERWARRWLDTAGYADSEGVLQEDRERPNAWRYRDYVIRAFNTDKPYDQFLREQIAGDELSDFRNAKVWTPEIEEQVVATGFLRTAVDATRDDFNEHQFTEYQYRMLHDTQTILVSSTLGVTLQCARCHDHKYEPLSQKDYYRIQAALTGAIRPKGKLLPTNRRQVLAATAADQQKATTDGKKAPAFPELRALYDQDATPPPTHLLIRGEYQKPGEVVEPGVPTVLANPKRPFVLPTPAPGASTTGRRTALANWIVSKENPLTARVMVNRVWSYHFGVGIVATLDNLGRSGKAPTHPELLDALAADFLAHGWKLKRLQKAIVLSQTYRQSSAFRPAAARRDPENRLLWRQRVQRLDAEAIRDGVLSVAGVLDPALYGEPVRLEVQGGGEVLAAGEAKGGRRSIYLQVRRTQPVTFLNAFDAPVMETNCTRRVTSATPTQALTLLNSSFMASQATHFAERLVKEIPLGRSDYRTRAARLERAYALALSRAPSPAEQSASLGFVQVQTQRYARLGKPNPELLALTDLCLALLSTNEFVYVD